MATTVYVPDRIPLTLGNNKPAKVNSRVAEAIHVAGWVFTVFILGLIGLFILSPGVSFNLVPAAIYIYLSGILVGYFNPGKWVISGLLGWGGVVLAVISMFGGAFSVILVALLLVCSVGVSLLGGFSGTCLRDQLKEFIEN